VRWTVKRGWPFNPLRRGGTHVGCVFVEDGVDGCADGDFLTALRKRMNS
jgi:hypothetical protein